MAYKGSEEDRRFVTLSAGELEEYLSSEVLLWRVKSIDLPLTPGNLLLAIKRLSVIEDKKLGLIIDQILQLIDTRRTAWEKKVSKELPMRLNQWCNQVEEIQRYGSLDSSYVYQVRTRVILKLLLEEKRYPDEHTKHTLEGADGNLYQITESGEFVWDESLNDQFPEASYPFLFLKDRR